MDIYNKRVLAEHYKNIFEQHKYTIMQGGVIGDEEIISACY